MHIAHIYKLRIGFFLLILSLLFLVSCSGSSSNEDQKEEINLSYNSFISSSSNSFCFSSECNESLISVRVNNRNSLSQDVEIFLNQEFYDFNAISTFQLFFDYDNQIYELNQEEFNPNLEGTKSCANTSYGKTCYWIDNLNMVNKYNNPSSKILSFQVTKKGDAFSRISISFRADGGDYLSLDNSSSILYSF